MTKLFRSKIAYTIVILVILPMVLVLSAYAYWNYKQNLKEFENHIISKRENLKREVKDLLNIIEETSDYSEELTETELKDASEKLVKAYEQSKGKLIKDDIIKTCKNLGIDYGLFEIYYLDTTLTVVNSNNPFQIGYQLKGYKNVTYNKRFDTLFQTGKFVADRSANAETDNRLRKFSYQATGDKRYIIEISLFPQKYKNILADFIKHINQLVNTQRSISQIGLFMSSERAIPLDPAMKIHANQKEIFDKCVQEKIDQIYTEKVAGNTIQYEYSYLQINNATFIDGWVMQVISTDSELRALQRSAFKNFLKQLGLYLIPLMFLLFVIIRQILKPLNAITDTINQIKEGQINQRISIPNKNEFGQLASEFNVMMDKESEHLAELEEKIEARTMELKISNEILEKRNSEREILIRETHHRVKNNLHMVNALLRLQSDQIEHKKTQMALQDLQDRISTMSNLHEFMFKNTQLSSYLSTKEYISRIVSETDKTYQSNIYKQYHLDIDDFNVRADDLLPFGLMLTELITNSHKYAFTNKSEANIYVSLKTKDQIKAVFEYGDDGIGFEPKDISSASLGLSLIHNFANQLGGKLEKQDKQGTWFIATLEFT
jgi:two-component sensor histidine kinase